MVIRTLDAGADKPLAFLRQEPEDNPFLGRRGIRLSLAEPALLHTQLRAILRVADEHPVKVMFPMVATLDELREARALLDAARAELGSDAPLEVGVMVEVPALALQAEQFAAEVDFFSVGTNDLTQYTMAAERGNAALALAARRDAGARARADRPGLRGRRGARPLGRGVRRAGRRSRTPPSCSRGSACASSAWPRAASRRVKAALRATDPDAASAAARLALPPGRRREPRPTLPRTRAR